MSDATAFRLWTRLTKATPDADSGAILHGGIFHDESEDIEGDVIPFEMIQKSFGYLGSHGKINWNHNREDIGDVLSVTPVSPAEAKEQFGVTITGRGTALTGTIYPLVDPALASNDLKTAHHRFRANARLGYSVDGMCSRGPDGKLRAVMVPSVAVCPQPINSSTICRRLVKGLGAMVEEVEVTDADLPEIMRDLEQAPDVLVDMSVPGGPEHVETAQVVIARDLFGWLVRKAFSRFDSPPLGGLRFQMERERQRSLRKAFQALKKA